MAAATYGLTPDLVLAAQGYSGDFGAGAPVSEATVQAWIDGYAAILHNAILGAGATIPTDATDHEFQARRQILEDRVCAQWTIKTERRETSETTAAREAFTAYIDSLGNNPAASSSQTVKRRPNSGYSASGWRSDLPPDAWK